MSRLGLIILREPQGEGASRGRQSASQRDLTWSTTFSPPRKIPLFLYVHNTLHLPVIYAIRVLLARA
jgi:hypothetical protein